MFLFKLLFSVIIFGVIAVLGVVLHVHSKYDNIILNMSHNDKIKRIDGTVVEIDRVCPILMNVYYFDDNNNYHQETWSEFMKMVGTYNLTKVYGKSHRKIEKVIMGF